MNQKRNIIVKMKTLKMIHSFINYIMNVFFLVLLNIIFVYGFINPRRFNIKPKLLCIPEIESIEDNNVNNPNYYKFGYFPRLEGPNINGVLTWYPIGFPNDFRSNKLTKITIRDKNYIIWKDSERFYGLKDACSHQGSSFQSGTIKKNCITCPYHGYTFNSNGELKDIPELKIVNNNNKIEAFKVIEKNGIVFLNTVPITDENENQIDDKLIWIEPEANDSNQKAVLLAENFEHNAKFVSVNSLDICHIGFVHTFGNRKNPNPVQNSQILKMNDSDYHYKIRYEYLSGANSIVSQIFNFNKIIVENEYILPHTTVARVIFGNYSSTIITMALPISKFKTRLFVKSYRNYWYTNLDKINPFNYLVYKILNKLGDMITYDTMFKTLKQDKVIVDNIDKIDYKTMHGFFSIKYDMMSNHYKHYYKKYYEFDKYIL